MLDGNRQPMDAFDAAKLRLAEIITMAIVGPRRTSSEPKLHD